MNMLDEARRLYALGFAIHWIHSRDKRPIKSGWNKPVRDSWPQLEREFRPSYNMGVLLGQASKFSQGYLAVIDCDVKSALSEDKEEMFQKLELLFPQYASWIAVESGRGNGSTHLYVKTKQPCNSKKLARSTKEVSVFMPSTEPRKRDYERLSSEEVEKGYRIRPAWEIELLSKGRQVVLPPSIHPDSGMSYKWCSPFENANQLALIETENISPIKTPPIALVENFTPIEVDLFGRLDAETIDMIVKGAGVIDRSASLLSVANRMYRAGFTNVEVLSVLTDPEYELGKTAYEHHKTESRTEAAKWLSLYTTAKARRENAAEEVFKAECNIEPLSEVEAQAQFKELCDIDRDKGVAIARSQNGVIKNTTDNLILVLEKLYGPTLFRFNKFTSYEEFGVDTPFGKRDEKVTETSLYRFKRLVTREFGYEPTNDKLREAVDVISKNNEYHPVQEYLKSLKWDGIPRINTWIKDYLKGVAEEPYLSAVSRKILVAMVRRAMEPGCKFDEVPILEGEQGVGKSTAARILAGDEWFTDAYIDPNDKDGLMKLRGKWVVEIGELSSMRKAQIESFKSFISIQKDHYRSPFKMIPLDYPRNCVFIGTTNSDEYLKDPTGNRRFWPIHVGKCDTVKLAQDRDQLFAEAMCEYLLGETTYLDEKEIVGAKVEQEKRQESDSWEDLLHTFFESQKDRPEAERFPEEFTMSDLFKMPGPFHEGKQDRLNQYRVGYCLRRLGFERFQKKTGRKNTKMWRLLRSSPS